MGNKKAKKREFSIMRLGNDYVVTIKPAKMKIYRKSTGKTLYLNNTGERNGTAYVSYIQPSGLSFFYCTEHAGILLYKTMCSKTTVKCQECGGTGRYGWGAIVNGKASHENTCFACKGKGKQTQADKIRNMNYHRFH